MERGVIVKVAMAYDKAKGDGFKEVQKGALQTETALMKMQRTSASSFGQIAGDVRKLDKGMSALSHGFQGLTMNFMMLGGQMQQAGGHMGKMADHAMKGVGALAMLHSTAQLARGSYMAMATASDYLAGSLGKVASAKSRVGTVLGMGVGGTVGGFGGYYAGQEMGLGEGGSIATMLGGAALGGWLGPKIGGGLARGVGWGAGKMGFAGAGGLGKAALGTAGALAIPAMIAGTVYEMGSAITNKALGRPNDTSYVGQGIDIYGNISTAMGQNSRSEKMQTLIAQGMQRRVMREQYRSQELGLSAARDERQRGIMDLLGGTTDTVLGGRGMMARRMADRRASLGLEGYSDLREGYGRGVGSIQDVLDSARGIMSGGGKGTAETEHGVFQAQQQLNRALQEQAMIETQIAQSRAAGNNGVADALHYAEQQGKATEKVWQTTQRLIEAERQHGQAEAERFGKWRDFAADQLRHFQSVLHMEQEKRKGYMEQFGELSPEEQARTYGIAQKLMTRGVRALDEDELGQAKRLGMFGDVLKSQYGALGNNDMFARIIAMIGGDAKMAEAQKAVNQFAQMKVDLENKVNVTLVQNQQTVEEMVERAVKPVVAQMIANDTAAWQAAMAKMMFQLNAAAAASNQP
jgi:hypothetical protein